MTSIKYTTTIELSAEDIKEILAEYVGRLDNVREHVEPKNVTFNVEAYSTGYGRDEFPTYKLAGAKVTIHK